MLRVSDCFEKSEMFATPLEVSEFNETALRMRNVISDVSDTSRGVVNISLFSKQSDTLSTYDITFDQSDHR